MIEVKDECVGCASMGMPCYGSLCPYRNVKYLICDECEESCEDLYEYEGQQLCLTCLLKNFKRLNIDEVDEYDY